MWQRRECKTQNIIFFHLYFPNEIKHVVVGWNSGDTQFRNHFDLFINFSDIYFDILHHLLQFSRDICRSRENEGSANNQPGSTTRQSKLLVFTAAASRSSIFNMKDFTKVLRSADAREQTAFVLSPHMDDQRSRRCWIHQRTSRNIQRSIFYVEPRRTPDEI